MRCRIAQEMELACRRRPAEAQDRRQRRGSTWAQRQLGDDPTPRRIRQQLDPGTVSLGHVDLQRMAPRAYLAINTVANGHRPQDATHVPQAGGTSTLRHAPYGRAVGSAWAELSRDAFGQRGPRRWRSPWVRCDAATSLGSFRLPGTIARSGVAGPRSSGRTDLQRARRPAGPAQLTRRPADPIGLTGCASPSPPIMPGPP